MLSPYLDIQVTPYPTTTVTNYETNVYLTNATFTSTIAFTTNPISLYTNPAPHPTESAKGLNGTQIVTGGTTIQSPSAFYVYSSVKIITAAAVTDSQGNVVCGTSSAFPSVYTEQSETEISSAYTTDRETYTVVETLYSTGSSGLLSPTRTITTQSAETNTFYTESISDGGSFTTTYTFEPKFSNINSNAEAYFGNATAKPTGVIISLTTPFVFIPPRGANVSNAGGEPRDCDQLGSNIDYGYPAQQVS